MIDSGYNGPENLGVLVLTKKQYIREIESVLNHIKSLKQGEPVINSLPL